MTDQPLDSATLDEHANAALDAAATPYVRCVYPLYSKARGGYRSEGSAVLAGRERPEFLISATHVLSKRQSQGLYVGLDDQMLAMNGTFRLLPAEDANAPDVGVCILAESTVDEASKAAFVAPAGIQRSLVDDPALHVLIGYPHTKQDSRVRDGVLDAKAMIFASHSLPESEVTNLGYHCNTDLLLEFNKRNVIGPNGRFNAPDPTGASGGGVWHAPNLWGRPDDPWMLSAIAIEWQRAGGKLIRATRVSTALSHLIGGASMIDEILSSFVPRASRPNNA